MSGHNKWSKVKHTKGPADAKRGQLFSKLSRELTLSARNGGDPALNARLRQAIVAAKAQNMPSDTMDRAIKKGTGELAGEAIEEILYEGYAPGGVAMLIEVATDNRNRSASDLRLIFSRNHGAFAEAGSVAYQFARKGEIRVGQAFSEESAMETALEVEAEDFYFDGEETVFLTSYEQLGPVAQSVRDRVLPVKSFRPIYQPRTTLLLEDVEVARQVTHLYDVLDEYEDTLNVYANFELGDEVMATLEAG